MKQGRGSEAIMYSAISSWMTSLFGVVLILALVPILFLVYKVWNTNVQAVLFGFTSIVIVLVSRNRLYMSILLFIIGNLLGEIGYSHVFNRNFFTFLSWQKLNILMTIQNTALICAAKIGNAFLAAFGCVYLQQKEEEKKSLFK